MGFLPVTSSVLGEEGQSQRRLFVSATVALALVLMAGTEMNSHVFPLFDPIFTFARDISVTAHALSLLVLGVVAYASTKVLTPRSFIVLAGVFLIVGAVGTSAALVVASPLLLTAGASICAIGRAGATLLACLALALLPARGQVLAICIAYGVQAVGQLFTPYIPSVVSLAFFQLFPLFALLLVAAPGASVMARVCAHEAPRDLSVIRPASFVAPFSTLFVCLFLFQAAFGFALRFGEVDGASPFLNVNWLFVAAFAAFALAGGKRFSMDGAVSFAALAVVGGFLLVLSGNSLYHNGAVLLLNGGNSVFSMVSRMVLVAIAARNMAGSVTVLAWGLGVTSLGSLVGAAAAVVCNYSAVGDSQLHFALPALFLMVFVAYMFFVMRSFSFAEAVADVEPLKLAPAATAQQESFQERCAVIGQRFGLSPREQEVFAMLARGRDRAYIEAELVVSKNTAKAHVKHIYAKLDIHSHQELLDLVEKG